MATASTLSRPAWIDESVSSFLSGESHMQILSGDTNGYAQPGVSHVAFLAASMRSRQRVVASYDRASGITFANDTERREAVKLLNLAGAAPTPAAGGNAAINNALAAVRQQQQPQQEGADPFSSAKQPAQAFPLLEQLLRSKSGAVAVIVKHAETLLPNAPKAQMAPDNLNLLVTLLNWANDDSLGAMENPIYLVVGTGKIAELHQDLRASTSGIKPINIASPDRAARLAYIQWYLADAAAEGAPVPMQGLDAATFANTTAGLSLRNIENIILTGVRAGAVTPALVKRAKDEIITAEYSEIAEMLDPLEGGFANVGGMERLVAWATDDIIEPVKQGRIGDVPKGCLFVGPPGTGKAQPLSAKVLTPTGWKCMGDVQVGDAVIDPTTGRATTVTGVYPQGKKKIYRVTFSDNTSVECCDEHLWLTQTRDARRDGGVYKVRSLAEIRETLLSSDGHPNHYIPLTSPVEFAESEPLPIDPYLLGVLIGDGHFGRTILGVTTADAEILTAVRAALPAGLVCEPAPSESRPYDYHIRRQKPYTATAWPKHSPLFTLLRELGMMGTRAADKHVPRAYLFASAADRLALLQGLLDTDGSVGTRDRYAVEFASNSRQLASDVAFLVQTLGGIARIAMRPGGSFRVNVKLPVGLAPFRLTRKAIMYQPAVKYGPRRSIVRVEFYCEQEAQCVAVASDAHLYVTEHCIVTHNTLFVRGLAGAVGFNAVALKMSKIQNSLVGESEARLDRFFQFVRTLEPCLVFLDEIDQTDVAARGNNSGNPVAKNLFGAMLQFMSDPSNRGRVVMCFASNRPDLLDPAMRRPGRMDAIIPVLMPQRDARVGIIEAQARMQGATLDRGVATWLADNTNDYSAADLEALVMKGRKLAGRAGHKSVTLADMQQAHRLIRSESPQMADYYTRLAIAACNDAEFLPPEYAALLDDRAALEQSIEAAEPASQRRQRRDSAGW